MNIWRLLAFQGSLVCAIFRIVTELLTHRIYWKDKLQELAEDDAGLCQQLKQRNDHMLKGKPGG